MPSEGPLTLAEQLFNLRAYNSHCTGSLPALGHNKWCVPLLQCTIDVLCIYSVRVRSVHWIVARDYKLCQFSFSGSASLKQR